MFTSVCMYIGVYVYIVMTCMYANPNNDKHPHVNLANENDVSLTLALLKMWHI